MAQERDFSSKNSPNSSDNEEDEISNGNNAVRPDLGFENVNYSNPEAEGSRSERKATNQARRDEGAFSFKHFLKRDLSLPSASASFEGTGARPRVSRAAPSPPSLPDFVQDQRGRRGEPERGERAERGERQAPPLALDLTDCVERPQPAPHPFPLDLPTQAQGAGEGKSSRLPDFLPARLGEGAASAALERDRERRHRNTHPSASGSEEDLVTALRLEVEQLKEELRWARADIEELRGGRRGVARSLLHATNSAEASLRELLSGLEQVRLLASSLEPP